MIVLLVVVFFFFVLKFMFFLECIKFLFLVGLSRDDWFILFFMDDYNFFNFVLISWVIF